MRPTYNPEFNVAYIRLCERQRDVETVEVTLDVLIDIDETGRVYGIELLDAKAQLEVGDGGAVVDVGTEAETAMKVA